MFIISSWAIGVFGPPSPSLIASMTLNKTDCGSSTLGVAYYASYMYVYIYIYIYTYTHIHSIGCS